MPGNGPVYHFLWPLADHDGIRHKRFSATSDAFARHAQGTARTQARCQIPAQCATSLNIQGLIDRLVADAHGRVLRVIDPKPTSDLLRAPCGRPTPTLAMNGTTLLPYHRRADEADTLCICDLAGKTLFHIGPQCRIGRQLAGARSRRRVVRMPLGRTGPVIQIAATGGSVTPRLP